MQLYNCHGNVRTGWSASLWFACVAPCDDVWVADRAVVYGTKAQASLDERKPMADPLGVWWQLLKPSCLSSFWSRVLSAWFCFTWASQKPPELMCSWRLRADIRFLCTQSWQRLRCLGASLVLCSSWSSSVCTWVAEDKLRCAWAAPVYRRCDARVHCQALRRTSDVVVRTSWLSSCRKALFLLGLPQV